MFFVFTGIHSYLTKEKKMSESGAVGGFEKKASTCESEGKICMRKIKAHLESIQDELDGARRSVLNTT